MRGYYEYTCRDVAASLKTLDTAIALNAMLAEAYCNRAMTYHDIGMMREALQDARRAVELDSTKALYWARLANTYGAFKMLDSVPYAVERALKIYPNYYRALCIKASYYSKKGMQAEALSELSKAIKLHPEKSYAYTLRFGIYAKLEKYKNVLADIDMALAIDTCLKELYFEKGYYSYKIGKPDDAMHWYNVAIEKKPRDIYAYYYRAWLYEKKGDTNKAGEDFLQAAIYGYDKARSILEARYPTYYTRYLEQRKK